MLESLLHRLRDRAGRRLPPHLQQARRGEDLAYRFVRKLGYKVVARNYRSRTGKGEIDLVGWDRGRLAFVEVKTRASEEFGTAGRAVDLNKRRQLIRTAQDYTWRANASPGQVRFDIVSVVFDETPPRICLEKDAFSARFPLGRGRVR